MPPPVPRPSVPQGKIATPSGEVTPAYRSFFTNLTRSPIFGLAANRPAATDVFAGTIYVATDTNVISASDGTTWYP